MSKRFKRDLLPKSKLLKKRKKSDKKQQLLGLGPKFIESVSVALREDDIVHVRKMVEGLSEYGLANLIEALSHSERTKLVQILGDKLNPEVFPELNDVVQEQVIESLQEKQIVKIANELDSDEVVEILEHMDEAEQESIIQKLDPELQYQVQSSLAYPEDSAGRIMSREFVGMPDWWTVKEAKEFLLKNEELPEDFYDIFLTDEKFRPTGQIALDKLLRAKPNEQLFDVMDGEVVPIDVLTDQEEVAHMFREYGWRSAMVVDNKDHLIGVITIDDVVEVIHEEVSEDIMHLSGTEEGDVYKSVFSIFKSRVMWLITNLVATILAASVVKGFQEVIAQVSVLAVLMPIVASMGGTTGNQTLAVVVRALATRELTSANTMRVIAKEFLVGLNNGLLFALLIGVITHVWFPDYQIVSIIIAIAMLVTLVIASLSGILVPLTLNKLKVDPAISSGVFLIAITDCGGFFVFLG
ncbi:MAG: magnesium transporter, partial [Alphaproteobacteria bacterium]|nr:magnesium transporter [Alphaproteobacteria bacterium]